MYELLNYSKDPTASMMRVCDGQHVAVNVRADVQDCTYVVYQTTVIFIVLLNDLQAFRHSVTNLGSHNYNL